MYCTVMCYCLHYIGLANEKKKVLLEMDLTMVGTSELFITAPKSKRRERGRVVEEEEEGVRASNRSKHIQFNSNAIYTMCHPPAMLFDSSIVRMGK